MKIEYCLLAINEFGSTTVSDVLFKILLILHFAHTL